MSTEKAVGFTCEACGKNYQSRKRGSRFCSLPCLWKSNGKHQTRQPEVWWVGYKGYLDGRVTENGVVRRVKQHRYVVEKSIGRPLLPSEDVHHINGDKRDNRLENLALMSHGEHTKITNNRPHKKGYKLILADAERQRRSRHMSQVHRSAALAKASTKGA